MGDEFKKKLLTRRVSSQNQRCLRINLRHLRNSAAVVYTTTPLKTLTLFVFKNIPPECMARSTHCDICIESGPPRRTVLTVRYSRSASFPLLLFPYSPALETYIRASLRIYRIRMKMRKKSYWNKRAPGCRTIIIITPKQ